MGMFLITRYDDLAAVVRSDAFISGVAPRIGQSVPPALAEKVAAYDHFLGHWMIRTDPPRHTRLRSLVSKAFTPQRIEDLRPFVQKVVNDRIDAARAAGRMDVIHDLGFPVPIAVICHMLGVPVEDAATLKGWTDGLIQAIGAASLTEEVMDGAFRGVRGLAEYFGAHLAKRKQAPGDDLVSVLARADETGDALTAEELASTAALLLVAGHETTTHLIGNMVFSLLQNPDQMQRLRDDPTLVPSAVEEVLRYESPVFMVTRGARADTEIGGKAIRAGQVVAIVFAAANRDPARFPDPDRMDITRTDNRHFGFGLGLHHCLGAPLARLEAQVVLETILEKLPSLSLTGEPLAWRPSLLIHSLASLPVTCGG
jgi:hypothetical protein